MIKDEKNLIKYLNDHEKSLRIFLNKEFFETDES